MPRGAHATYDGDDTPAAAVAERIEAELVAAGASLVQRAELTFD